MRKIKAVILEREDLVNQDKDFDSITEYDFRKIFHTTDLIVFKDGQTKVLKDRFAITKNIKEQ